MMTPRRSETLPVREASDEAVVIDTVAEQAGNLIIRNAEAELIP